MIAPAIPRRDSQTDPAVRFVIDPDAEPGDVVVPLASLLIDIDRRRKQRLIEQTSN